MANTYTEIVGAQVIHETAAAYKFTLGDEEHWVPKSQSKVENDKLYMLHWVAEQKKRQLGIGVISPEAAERLVELLREALAILRTK